MDLGGTWRAAVADEDLRRTWLDTDDDHDWDPVTVPGHWRSDRGFERSDGPLLYRTRFEHQGPTHHDERWWLRFDGLFYQGDVWLDGSYVGDTEGYFVPHTFEVTEALAARTEHTLGVEVTCNPPGDLTAKRNITGSFQHASYLDPAWNPGGIWRPVQLERTGPVRIRHARVLCRDASERLATVAFRVVLDAAVACEVSLRSTVGGVDHVVQRRLAAGENQVEWTVGIDDPALWWPHALGDQPLHEVIVAVTPVDEATGLPIGGVSHRITRRIGLREVHLNAWVLHVNGERLFLKGANLGPTDMRLAEARPSALVRDVELAKAANLDLIRLHAHISRPELYDAADEAGMLIWQDFPLHRGYARSIRKQAQRQAREAVDLLAHHPSVAIWCAHDEPLTLERDLSTAPDEGVSPARYVLAQELPSWNRTILDRSVKRAIEKADGSRPVIAHSGVLPHPPQLDGTDSHLSFGWNHGDERDLAGFARAVPRMVRFVSEFGAQSVPTSARFASPERWPDLDWEALADTHGMQRGVFDRRVPAVDHPSFEAWQQATQEYQADLITHHVLTLRRLKYRPTGGFAQFLLADGHPAISGSVLDHERTPKLAYHALAEACRPVVVVADRLPAELVGGETLALDVHVVSDLRRPVEQLEVTARLAWEGGEQRWRFGGAVAADTCVRVGTLQVEVPDEPGPVTLHLELTGQGVPGGTVTRTDRSRIVLA
ncbi:glycoside hydrolase family 2 protein [Aquihabitans sp. McL0605]|uniref:glycoside hydrolase family 2 protein n=1 Tax=Aquihabitans sp. McL0605 TaxID=3415671 RepID=UPI003CFAF7C5